MLVLPLLACRGPADTTPGTVPPFTWTDTAVLTDWTPALQFDGAPPKNLLVISIDTLRRDAIGRYGGSGTPTLDRLLATGVALDDHAQCSNWTFASTTCTLTGRYLEEDRVVPRLTIVPEPLPHLPSLAEFLGDDGFYSLLVSGNPWLSPAANNAQGFDEVASPGDPTALGVWGTGRRLLEDAVDRGDAGRWYLHLHLLEPHEPYDPPDAYLDGLDAWPPAPWDLTDHDTVYGLFDDWSDLPPDEQQLLQETERVRYDGEVRWLDDQLGTILDEAEADGLLDDALVMLWSDHGEAFWEHGHPTHAWTLHAEESDGVALFWGHTLRPLAWTGPTSAVDLVPTALTALGLELPTPLSGVPVGAGAPDRARFAAVNARSGVEQSVIRDGWKLRYHWSGLAQLYDRVHDPAEAHDVLAQHPDTAEALWSLLQPRVDAMVPLVDATPVPPAGL